MRSVRGGRLSTHNRNPEYRKLLCILWFWEKSLILPQLRLLDRSSDSKHDYEQLHVCEGTHASHTLFPVAVRRALLSTCTLANRSASDTIDWTTALRGLLVATLREASSRLYPSGVVVSQKLPGTRRASEKRDGALGST